jgi:hypothetical protein
MFLAAAVIAILTAFVISMLYKRKHKPFEVASDGWWTSRERPAKEDLRVTPFIVGIKEENIVDLKDRLSKTRWIGPFEDGRYVDYGHVVCRSKICAS